MKKQLIDILEKGHLKYNISLDTNRIVAEVPGVGVMPFEDYSEKNLQEIVAKNRKCYVDIEFWNYNYCSFRNINPVHVGDFLENVNFIIKDKKSFSEGTLVILILLNELILNIFKIENKKTFELYIDQLKISKKIIRNFLINVEYQLPLTENYLYLILKVFDETSIYDFLFRECCYFTLEETRTILNYYEVKDIHLAGYYIFNNFRTTELKLKYISFVIDAYEGNIDYNNYIYYKGESGDPVLGYYLLTLEYVQNNQEQYYYVMKKYVEKSGSLKLQVIGNEEETEKISQRRKEIETYLDRH